ncbi:hypothetical protein [Streptosporangium sp. NPDC006930]|uniref:hypothetical protein n=1 Tax=unclassified Streptosporangium TaxID=2632669 RepID=UPI00341B593C
MSTAAPAGSADGNREQHVNGFNGDGDRERDPRQAQRVKIPNATPDMFSGWGS